MRPSKICVYLKLIFNIDMCGIVGYTGRRNASEILLTGLHRLEYRGYDSAGMALINGSGDIMTYKSRGKVSMLEEKIKGRDVDQPRNLAKSVTVE